MGLGPAAVKLNLELWQRGIFKNIESVIDIGSQEIHLKKAHFEELIQAAGIYDYDKKGFDNLANWPGYPRCSSRALYEMLGIKEYSCIDLNGQHGAVSLDLNFPLQDASLYNKYDLVTDHGSNEHVFNVAEAYRTMHRLCKKQRLIVIMQNVYRGNGYYTFDSSFFEGLAATNNYRIIFSSYVIDINAANISQDASSQYHIPLSHELLEALDWSKQTIGGIGICYVMQKQTNDDFKYPYQGLFLSQVQNNYGYQIQFLPNPPSRTYLPLILLESVPTKQLLKKLSERLIQKSKQFLRFR